MWPVQVKRFVVAFPHVPVIALTATATARVQADVMAALGVARYQLLLGSFNRSNIEYRVCRVGWSWRGGVGELQREIFFFLFFFWEAYGRPCCCHRFRSLSRL